MDTTVKIAVVSASAAILGVLVSQGSAMLQEFLNRKHQKKKLLREKYEQLADHVTESHLWVTGVLQAQSLSQATSNTPIHARKAATLAAIYFPLLLEDAQNYLNACAMFHVVILENHEFVSGVTAGAQAAHRNKQAFEAASEKVHYARQMLDDKIIEYANKYTRA